MLMDGGFLGVWHCVRTRRTFELRVGIAALAMGPITRPETNWILQVWILKFYQIEQSEVSPVKTS